VSDLLPPPKDRVVAAVDRLADELEALSHRIHDHPELGYQEERAHAWLTAFLEGHGARVERGVGGLPTAFRATIPGTGPGPTVAILCEYDALPGLGHACGHNVIAAAGAGAGAALATAFGTLPYPGCVVVLGTPAEEGGAGKVKLLEAGLFRGVDAAMMVHGRCSTRVWRPSLGIVKVTAEFYGRAAHASSWPWRGVNALNAVIQLFLGLDAMRQHLRPDARVHGVIRHGGTQPNIIPEYASAEFYLRALDRAYCFELLRRFEACAAGAARATGCQVTVAPDPVVHEPLKPNATLARLFADNLARLGIPEDPEDLRIAPDGVPGHSREFAEWARSPMARAGLLAGAKALAMTALDLLSSPAAVRQAWDDFARGGGMS
jgi:amidohydrolase